MELKQGTGIWAADWWMLVKPTREIVMWICKNIPQNYRTLDEGVWYVHEKHVHAVRTMMASDKSRNRFVEEDDPWALLHLRPGAPQAIIKVVWRELAKELHPDRGGDAEKFIRVKAAYEKLMKV